MSDTGSFTENLSSAQKRAALHVSGPALCLAGPGSGKTTTVMARTACLVLCGVCKPERLLTVTFTRAAADEMRMRFKSIAGKAGINRDCEPEFSTIHSFCLRFLNSNCNNKYSVLSDGPEKRKIVGQIISDTYRANEAVSGRLLPRSSRPDTILFDFNRESAERIFGLLSKRKMIESEHLSAEDTPLFSDIRYFEEIYEKYEKYKKENGVIDYDDMVAKTVFLLESDEKLRKKIQNQYDYIQVDEGQDLSMSQIKLLSLICGNGNIFLVADDDQSIYGFRGAAPDGIFEYEKMFKDCKIYYLSENYRSNRKVVEMASEFIKTNKKRYEKNIIAGQLRKGNISVARTLNVSDQARFVSELAVRKAKKGESTGILYRSGISADALVLYLSSSQRLRETALQSGVKILGGFFGIHNNPIVKNFLDCLFRNEAGNNALIGIRRSVKNTVNGYLNETVFSEGGIDFPETKRELGFIAEYLSLLCSINSTYSGCADSLRRAERMLCDTPENALITLSTVHSSKGLEYDNVIIIDAAKDEFPSKGNDFGELLEEERRLFYVAVTRAKNNLTVCFPETCGLKEQEESIFIKEMRRFI